MIDIVSNWLERILHVFYPGIMFDAAGLTNLLLPCLAIVFISLIVSILIKLNARARRFAYLPVIIALIVTITLSSFFPVSLTQAGQYAVQQIHQTDSTKEP